MICESIWEEISVFVWTSTSPLSASTMTAAVRAGVEDGVGVEGGRDPRAGVGNRARRVGRLGGGQRLALVVVEEDAGGALELADDDPFGAVDDERALVGHEGKLTEVDFLTALFPDGPRLRLFVVVENDEAQRDLQGDREGHAAVMALLDRVLRITEVVRVELQQCVVVVVRDGKHRLEHRLQPDLLPAVRGSILLQKRLVRALLHLDEIRNLDDRRDLAEVLPTAAPALDSACHTLSRGRSPALSSTPSLNQGAVDHPRLLHLHRRALLLELLLHLLRLGLGDLLLHRLRGAVDEILRFLEPEPGELADDLDHLDLL